jgi:hypothetical protein
MASICRIERGQADRFAMRRLFQVAEALGARVHVRVLWQGEELDRLLDRAHAQLVDEVVRRLHAAGWVAEPEATYQVASERGSIDVLAWHPAIGHVLVVEVKSTIPDVQSLLAGINRKARVAPIVAGYRGWGRGPVSRLLVLPDDRTVRRRVGRFAATFDAVLPERSVAVRRWIRSPDRPLAGILFLTNLNPVKARQRVPARTLGGAHAHVRCP